MNDENQVQRNIVELRALSRSFGTGESQVDAVRDVDLLIACGEFTAIMGPSGSGKSTLLHLIGGLDEPTAGTVTIDGQDLSQLDDNQLTLLRRRQFGFVFQAFNLLDVLTAQENVALVLGIDGIAEDEANRRAMEALAVVEMRDRAGHFPSQLSGGQQQRLAIARALVTQPLILLADEPTGNLDSANSDQIVRYLRQLADESGQTILMVTHEARHAATADRVIELRDGRITGEHRSPSETSWQDTIDEMEPKP